MTVRLLRLLRCERLRVGCNRPRYFLVPEPVTVPTGAPLGPPESVLPIPAGGSPGLGPVPEESEEPELVPDDEREPIPPEPIELQAPRTKTHAKGRIHLFNLFIKPP
jgi:hypothetical protein